MKNKILKIAILALMIMIFTQIGVFANTLTLNITSIKQQVKAGDKFTVIVSWGKGMQAADYYLKYDSEKLKFVKADISEDYMNTEKSGEIKTAWVSLDDTDKTEIKYTFKAKKSGTVEFETKVNGGFATGDLKIPKEYNEGKLTLEIAKQPLVIRILKIFAIVIVAFIVIRIIIVFSTKKSKKGRKKEYVNKYFK